MATNYGYIDLRLAKYILDDCKTLNFISISTYDSCSFIATLGLGKNLQILILRKKEMKKISFSCVKIVCNLHEITFVRKKIHSNRRESSSSFKVYGMPQQKMKDLIASFKV